MAEALPVEKGAAGDNAITERFCGEMLLERAPALVVRWLSEPDCTSHHTPLSLPEHKRAIATADGNVRRIAETVALSTPAAGVYYSSSALIEQSIINHPAWYRRCSRVPTDRIAKPLIVWVILSCWPRQRNYYGNSQGDQSRLVPYQIGSRVIRATLPYKLLCNLINKTLCDAAWMCIVRRIKAADAT